MYAAKIVFALALLLSISARITLAQSETQQCGQYADSFLATAPCSGIDLDATNCTSSQVANCLGQTNMTLYNQYACCKYDVLASAPESNTGRKLSQGNSCFTQYTGQTIQYETKNIVPILKYCKSIGYKTNYSAIFGDPAVLAAIDQVPEAAADQTPKSAPKSAASHIGFSGLAVALLLGFLLLV